MPTKSAITIHIYKINPENGERCEIRTVRHPGGPTEAFTARWPACTCPRCGQT
ncbi:hypothetical protein ACFC1R_28245 [Kitasatospora sp. NPDC056138]|uniref:hypothetical protein n=1 Tax=Kitasatospora sp. NPDC056138 TaxID=3345724 RepID=UPI0035E0CA31